MTIDKAIRILEEDVLAWSRIADVCSERMEGFWYKESREKVEAYKAAIEALKEKKDG